MDTVGDLLGKNGDDVAFVYKGNRLDSDKVRFLFLRDNFKALTLLLQTFLQCGVRHEGDAIVEPISLHFVFRKEGLSQLRMTTSVLFANTCPLQGRSGRNL